MAGSNQQIAVNGSEMWVYVVETAEGLRLRFNLDDWLRLNLDVGIPTTQARALPSPRHLRNPDLYPGRHEHAIHRVGLVVDHPQHTLHLHPLPFPQL